MKQFTSFKIKLFFILIICIISISSFSQNCEKGCGKITKVEPTTNPKVRADRALLVFKFQGPDGKPVKSHVKIIFDNDTIKPVLDKTGSTKMTGAAGNHKIKFKADWWYSVTMSSVSLKVKNTYYFFVRFEAKEIMGKGGKDE